MFFAVNVDKSVYTYLLALKISAGQGRSKNYTPREPSFDEEIDSTFLELLVQELLTSAY